MFTRCYQINFMWTAPATAQTQNAQEQQEHSTRVQFICAENPGTEHRDWGIEPVTNVSCTHSVRRLESNPNWDGMLPVKTFEDKYKLVNLVSDPTSDGMLPVN
mmetsp:Transcript_3574/g.7954  ORF Transcript_3574/g.7954 Transcript_3574/m.7954 type:complete len:103 (-) Transcript_3574:487-795(-)